MTPSRENVSDLHTEGVAAIRTDIEENPTAQRLVFQVV